MRIVITGTSSGIGRALAERLMKKGHHVLGLARTDQAEFAARAGNAFRHRLCDVSSWEQLESCAQATALEWPSVDGLICCAGSQGEVGPTVSASPLKWTDTVRTNLDGTFYAVRAFYNQLALAQHRSKIICFSGGGATKSRPNFSAYGVAKAGVVRLVETLAEELRDRPIDINAIAPGAINTRLTDEVIALGAEKAGVQEFEAAKKQKATGGASMDKALDLVEWLLSEESDGISGRLISAPWDPWPTLKRHNAELAKSDIYQLRRIVPEDRGLKFDV